MGATASNQGVAATAAVSDSNGETVADGYYGVRFTGDIPGVEQNELKTALKQAYDQGKLDSTRDINSKLEGVAAEVYQNIHEQLITSQQKQLDWAKSKVNLFSVALFSFYVSFCVGNIVERTVCNT